MITKLAITKNSGAKYSGMSFKLTSDSSIYPLYSANIKIGATKLHENLSSLIFNGGEIKGCQGCEVG